MNVSTVYFEFLWKQTSNQLYFILKKMVAEGQLHKKAEGVDYCLTLRHEVLITESLKLARTRNLTLDMSILADISLSQIRRMGFVLGKFPTKVGLHG